MKTLWDLVCDVEYSKRIKELGYSRPSYFIYIKMEDSIGLNGEPIKRCWGLIYIHEYHSISEEEGFKKEYYEIYPAYTVGELAEDFPNEIPFLDDGEEDISFLLSGRNLNGEWWVNYTNGFKDEKEANARAKMLIYLLENGLIKP
jgi:hypothetical protein